MCRFLLSLLIQAILLRIVLHVRKVLLMSMKVLQWCVRQRCRIRSIGLRSAQLVVEMYDPICLNISYIYCCTQADT